MEEITITFVCKDYPKKLAAHLKEVRHFEICELEAGIYYIMGDILPIQLIIVSQLCRRDNLWLSSLTNDLNKRKTIDELVEECQIHQNNSLYQAVMNVIVHANENKFEEEKRSVKHCGNYLRMNSRNTRNVDGRRVCVTEKVNER